MNNKGFSFLIVLIIACGLVNMAGAQDTVLRVPELAKLDSLNSTILKEKRLIQVFTPANYKPGSTDKFDVLYVLDGGNWNTGLIKQVQRFVEGEAYMPPTIIVSVMGIDRNKDLTPTRINNWGTSGGAANFLGFIKNELIPYVNKAYPTNGDNTLWGHSLGGMFVLYAMLNEPALFKSYIAVDPSLWWDNCLVPKMAAGKLPAFAGLNTTLYISGREGEDGKGMRIDTMDAVLKKSAPAGLNWKIQIYPNETHSSLRLKSTYDGLKYTYSGFTDAIEYYPANGILLKDKPFSFKYFEDTTKVRYTTDGTEPTLASAKIEQEITLNAGATLTLKRFTNRAQYNRVATGHFVLDDGLRVLSKPGGKQPGGLNYAYYEGDWQEWPDLKQLKPTKTGITDKDFEIDKLPKPNNYALVIDGLIKVTEDGYYMFLLNADKNTRFYVGNKLIMTWNGTYKHRTDSFLVPLKKGFYPLRIEYLRRNKDFKLEWAYITPANLKGMDAKAVPVELQYGSK
jgi:predicted alpha/beta superfamily hydrolase